MSAMRCEICGTRLDDREFYLGVRDRCVCPACVPLFRSVVPQGRPGSTPTGQWFDTVPNGLASRRTVLAGNAPHLRPMFR